jgi:heat shock protein HslJ
MRHTTFLAFVALALVMAGCAKDGRDGDSTSSRAGTSMPPPPDTSTPVSVTGTDWVLTRLGNEPALPAEPVKARPWFNLDPGRERRVTGNTGVNLLSGSYELSGGALQFGKLITTRRASEPAMMRQETGFTNALEKTATAELSGRKLVLRDAGRATRAEFEAIDVTP